MTEKRGARVPAAQPAGTNPISARPSGWVAMCAVAEGIGMTAAAVAARASEGLPGYAGLLIVVTGGLIEGAALGILQASWLARRFPGLSRVRWAVVTLLIAGLGWALAAAPSTLGEAGGADPGPLLTGGLSAALGMIMGGVLGAGQALVLRNHVRHPWRWVPVSALAWTPAMVIIFAGATIPAESWSTLSVTVAGAITGLCAGAVLGLVSVTLMPTLGNDGHTDPK